MLHKKKYSKTILLHEVGEESVYCFTMFVPDPGGIERVTSPTRHPLPSSSRNLSSTRIQAHSLTIHQYHLLLYLRVKGCVGAERRLQIIRGVGVGSEKCQVVMSCVLSS
jgi:hypothetical protein